MPFQTRIVVAMPGTNTLEVKSATLPDPAPHDVIVEQRAGGICHSQLHEIHGPRATPHMLGHESTGYVLAVGSEVTAVQEGDYVIVTWVPRLPRTEAEFRVASSPVITFEDGTVADTHNVFTWATVAVADEQFVVKAPMGTPWDLGSIIGCAVMTGAGAVKNTAGVKAGESVAVWGVGGVGLSAIVAAAIAGANPIIAVDLDDEKLEMARRFGATETVNAKDVDPIAAVRALTPGTRSTDIGGVDWAFDCIGRQIATQQALSAVRGNRWGQTRGGTAMLVGVPTEPINVNGIELLVWEKHLVGSVGGSCAPDVDFPVFIDWFTSGKLDLAALVTAKYTIDEINQACSDLEQGKIAGRAILDYTAG